MLTEWLEAVIKTLAALAPPDTFFSYTMNINGFLAVVLVGLICGAVSSLVVGNRMAFFSDALAHCSFAGVALGLLAGIAVEAVRDGPFLSVGLPIIMVSWGILIGLAIAFVRENTSLGNDTIIGVFFAGSMGFGAMLLGQLNVRTFFNPETFLFGSLVAVRSEDLLVLAGLTVVAAVVLGYLYNGMVLTSFNASLARSRRVPVRLCNYLFIVLLALIVNLCLKIVGALLINALLLVPVATACNLSRNMRQLFWLTTGLCVFVGVGGQVLNWELQMRAGVQLSGVGGTIVVLSVILFFLSMLVPAIGFRLRRRNSA